MMARDWEGIARAWGWETRESDPAGEVLSPGPILYHPEQDRVWPFGDWEGAARDVGWYDGVEEDEASS